MSSKCAKKNITATKSNNAIVTRNKSAQNGRQLRAKNKKTVKPVIKKPEKPETKVTNTPSETCEKVTPLQTKVRHLVQLVEQVEYYPDKLKRDYCEKKTFLRPKHNFKLIASTSKRKLSVPRKGGPKSIPPLTVHRGNTTKAPKYIKAINYGNHSSDVSMVDMVKLIEDNHSLSEEDFMEILTCPSPVWWEDPPDEGYFEDAICTRVPSPSSHTSKNQEEIMRVDEQKNDRVGTPVENTLSIDFEHEIKGYKTKSTNTKAFTKKKQKLESLLQNIKTDKQNDCTKSNEVDINKNNENSENDNENKNKITTGKGKTKNVSLTTDEEDLSDLSFNEEDILTNLENMDIPIEQNLTQTKIEIGIQGTETKTETKLDALKTDIKNELIIPDVLPPLKRKPEIRVNNKTKSDDSDSNLEYNLDIVSHSNFRFISDDDINIVEMNVNTNMAENMKIVDISSTLTDSSSIIDVDTINMKDYEVKKEQIDNYIADGSDKNNEFVPRKVINDLSEYITVYKILSNDSENNEVNKQQSNKTPNNADNSKLEKVRGKLNNFFKKCKGNKRLKKTDSSFPAISVRNINDLKIK